MERSADGKIFDQIGHVQGSGTTSEVKSYQFLDRSPEIGFNFYRLKQVDFNGEFEYSEIRSVKHETISHFQVFPNPTSDYLVVNAPGLKSDANASYQLINELGQIAQKGSLTSYTRLDVSDRENGIYFLQIFNDQKIILRTIKIYVLK